MSEVLRSKFTAARRPATMVDFVPISDAAEPGRRESSPRGPCLGGDRRHTASANRTDPAGDPATGHSDEEVSMARVSMLAGAAALALAVSAVPALAGSPSAATGFKSDTGGLPTFSQVNGYTSKVKVKHVSCGKDCWTHGLVSKNGNLNLKAKMGFACPPGDAVDQIYYSVGGSDIMWAYKYAGVDAQQSRIIDVTLQPWTPAMFEGAAISALGPSWSGDKDDHHNNSNTATIAMHQDVEVFANCQEDQTTRHKSFKVNTKATIVDLE
ncbi:MAG: hypothetical protein HC871_06745 [Rhizobiales bacterium]|nr:hypothetical protein [Hyphomicrobiales bacterium]